MIKLVKMGLFATPKNQDALEEYINLYTGQERVIAHTICGMTWNLVADMIDDAVDNLSLDKTGDDICIKVGNIRVRVHRTDEGVVCDMYAENALDKDGAVDSDASCYAFFHEAEEDCTDEDIDQFNDD